MPGLDFETVVASYYEPLYRFAMSLTHSEADACDLAQQTFYMWATKGHQLRDLSKVKSWLFTTLHRAFLESRRTLTRFPHSELTDTDADLLTFRTDLAGDVRVFGPAVDIGAYEYQTWRFVLAARGRALRSSSCRLTSIS